MGPQVISGNGLPMTLLPFSAAVRAGDFVFVSGQASVDDDGTLHPDTFENEFHRTMNNLTRILAAAGLSLRHVVQARSYVRDHADLAKYNELYRQYFNPPYPARTTITNCMGKLKYEIDVVAYKEPMGT